MELNERLTRLRSKPSPKKYGLKTAFQLGSDDDKKEVFSLCFDSEDKYLAAAIGDGSIWIYNLLNNKLATTIQYSNPMTGDSARAMCVKWRRMDYFNEAGTKRKQSMLVACFSDGVVNEYISPLGKLSSSIIEENNETFVLDIDGFEEKFCTGGKDYRIRLYDWETKELIMKMMPATNQGKPASTYETQKLPAFMPQTHIYYNSPEPGHAQRIFGLSYKKEDPNVIISGGWDKKLQIHDIREKGPVGYIFGPDLSSNSLSVYENVVVTGSHRSKNPLQTWDLRKKELIQNLEWDYSNFMETYQTASESSYLNWAAFTHSGDKIIAGGKGEEIKIFESDGEEVPDYHNIGKITDFNDSILWCTYASTNNDFAVGTADGVIKIFTNKLT